MGGRLQSPNFFEFEKKKSSATATQCIICNTTATQCMYFGGGGSCLIYYRDPIPEVKNGYALNI